jgi:glycosyltransferase involved in cell wall biosynthesis
MNITIHTITYNEEILMQFMIDHYRTRFPNCHIVVYDNQSTDKTVEICKLNNCEMRHFDTGRQLNDQMTCNVKNSCWQNAKTDWVLIQDLDELLDINAEQLLQEESKGITKIKSECWHMVNMENNIDVHNIKYGYRNVRDDFCIVYDKDLLFNKKYVNVIYEPGAHRNNSVGIVKNSKSYKLLHYMFINPDIYVAKQKLNKQRLSEINIQKNWSLSLFRSENEIRAEFQKAKNNAIKIL